MTNNAEHEAQKLEPYEGTKQDWIDRCFGAEKTLDEARAELREITVAFAKRGDELTEAQAEIALMQTDKDAVLLRVEDLQVEITRLRAERDEMITWSITKPESRLRASLGTDAMERLSVTELLHPWEGQMVTFRNIKDLRSQVAQFVEAAKREATVAECRQWLHMMPLVRREARAQMRERIIAELRHRLTHQPAHSSIATGLNAAIKAIRALPDEPSQEKPSD